MRYRKVQKTPFKSFESEEEWENEVERIVDMTISKLNEKLKLISDYSDTSKESSYDGNTENQSGDLRMQSREPYSSESRSGNINGYDSSKARFYEIKKQADEYQKKNPSFNMAEEMKNRSFCYLVFKLGVSVEDAYFLVHKEEILKERENGNRITENGAFKNQGIQTKLNPEKFSDEDVAKILDRIQDGESITF